MAVAWSKDKVGRANGDVIIRDPVVLTATLPRFLLNGDRGTMHLDLDNVEGAAGEYRLEVRERRRQRGRQCRAADAAARRQAAQRRDGAAHRARGRHRQRHGAHQRARRASRWSATTRSAVKPATQILARRTVQPIAKGESLTLSNDLFADLVPGTGSVAVSVGVSTALDAAALLAALDRYPFGCSEQITSRALPLLYVNDLASEAHLALDTAVDQRIRDAIDRLLARQGSNGSFGLWSAGGDDVWLDAYVTDFLTRARERGFRGARRRVQARARPAAQLRRQRRRSEQERRPRSRLCALRAGAQRRRADRRPALFRRHQARRLRHADRQGADRRGARHARRPRARRARLCGGAATRSRRSRCSNTAAPTTARSCAMRRRW